MQPHVAIEPESVNNLVEVPLFAYQAKDLWELVRRQEKDRKGLIFMSVAPYMLADECGWARLRMQAAFVSSKAAQKILKLIQAEIKPNDL